MAISKVTPPAGAGVERLTVNVNIVVPPFPSLCEISLIESVGFTERTDEPCCDPARARIVVSPDANAVTFVVWPVVGAGVAFPDPLESQTNETF